ncbi:MAG: SUF system NifU family Fe-S cluster assembly protein [Bacilli bacterium]|jgi:nitrogen fixation NifU-like protein
MDNNLRRTIILENYAHPFNKNLINDSKYEHINVNNESCIDNIDLMVDINNNMIEDIHFTGEACAISTSATSIMIKTLLHKTIDEALDIINEYEKMIDEQAYDADILGEMIVYDEIYKQPNRKKCALLPAKGLKKVLEAHK